MRAKSRVAEFRVDPTGGATVPIVNCCVAEVSVVLEFPVSAKPVCPVTLPLPELV